MLHNSMEQSDFLRWIDTSEGQNSLKMMFSLTGGSSVVTTTLSEMLHWSLNRSDYSVNSFQPVDLNRRERLRISQRAFGGQSPKHLALGFSNRSQPRRLFLSLIYHEQTFSVHDEVPGQRYEITIPFLYDQVTGLLFSRNPPVECSNRVRSNFIHRAISYLGEIKIFPWETTMRIRRLSVPLYMNNLTTADPKWPFNELSALSEIIADNLKTEHLLPAEWEYNDVLSTECDEQMLLKRLTLWVKLVNVKALDNLLLKAGLADGAHGHEVSVKELFPRIRRLKLDFSGIKFKDCCPD